jgi:tetratricopeptide (TPR) repeat protein|uniref:Tetratricopeptide SHNi-TPR domain-containing protein n=1 Tax=Phaeodactylum tricornutum TaxID=2850 RepID=A0A8J9SYD2_PHATR
MAAPASTPSGSASRDATKEDFGQPDPVGVSVQPAPGNLKAPPPAPPVVTKRHEPSYGDSEGSDHYTVAKSLLNDGDFENALATIEEGIEKTRNDLEAHDPEADPDRLALHPAMAPFHYLYGTTLLYSIEESTDTQAMAMPHASAEQEPQGGDTNGPNDGQHTDLPTEEVADEMQIAYENLEAARVIVEALRLSQPENTKLQLDLAQIFLREADLQRMNGQYDAALQDYTSCLSLRQSLPEALLGPYDRKIADVHYNLALVYSLAVAEAVKPTDDPHALQQHNERLALYRKRSCHHYVTCGRILCGQIAALAGQDPDTFLQKALDDLPSFKSTGEEDGANDENDHPKLASLKLQTLRRHAAQAATSMTSLDAQETAHELLDLLQEIQETIDESENSEQGVQTVASMKAEISAAVAAQPGDDDEEGAGTALGLEDSNACTATTTIGFGSSAASESTEAVIPLLAVRKKPKRTADDAKLPALDDSRKKPSPSNTKN